MSSTLTPIENELIALGYCRNPNEDIFGLPGTGWYAGYGGLPGVDWREEVRAVSGWIEVHNRDSRRVMIFPTVAEFVRWSKENRPPSLPGLPPYANGFD